MEREEFLIKDLPDPESARRFLGSLVEDNPSHYARLMKNESLASDVLALAAFSPLLATTLTQNPDYIWWLDRKRRDGGIRGKDELLESLARFSLTNSQLDPQVLFARFRRRELLRIYLRDIRRLATIAEITEEISNLADAILETALKTARREMDNRFGQPQDADEKGRSGPAHFCIAALGKLGSRELNFSSDIDLFFLYSVEGVTTGAGSRGQVTNREYFVKLAEFITKLIGQQTGEGAAYRVDLRLRPHGTLGALALTVRDTIRYYKKESRAWERQVMIRSRCCAGDPELFREFFGEIEDLVFSTSDTVESAFRNVRLSKESIDREQLRRPGIDVKLGRGGIREIEFIAQALQLAYGGHDKWLRSAHTLITLARLADRKHLTDTELTDLSSAYVFLRRTEHVLQMENGVQTHTVPENPEKRGLLGRRVMFPGQGDFEQELAINTENVSRVFARIFGKAAEADLIKGVEINVIPALPERTLTHLMASIEKSDVKIDWSESKIAVLEHITTVSPHFSAMLAAKPEIVARLPDPEADFVEPDYESEMMTAIEQSSDLGQRLSAMRRTWSALLLEIAVRDIFEKLTIAESKRLQTSLAEASIAAALRVVRDELAHRFIADDINFDLAILALGKLGGRGLDYDSDLDLVIVYFDPKHQVAGFTPAEFYSRAVELFATALSSMTRDGNLYRVDLRLRPFGSKGLSAMSIDSFLEYMGQTAAIWEMLAFVKLRHVGGDKSIGYNVENETRLVIHQRASAIPVEELRTETVRVRTALEQERVPNQRRKEIDIKYGSGGMLDVYFAMRFLQLRDNLPDSLEDRTTAFTLETLRDHGSLSPTACGEMLAGYQFLSKLDHNMRLTVGRTTRVPLANTQALSTIAGRMGLVSATQLLESLTLHRIAIRSAFDSVLAVPKSGKS